jgi:hypothetical protein
MTAAIVSAVMDIAIRGGGNPAIPARRIAVIVHNAVTECVPGAGEKTAKTAKTIAASVRPVGTATAKKERIV